MAQRTRNTEGKTSIRKVTFSYHADQSRLGFFGSDFSRRGSVMAASLVIRSRSHILDALFASVSAVCVTGLVTVIPAEQFTLLGKIILLLLDPDRRTRSHRMYDGSISGTSQERLP